MSLPPRVIALGLAALLLSSCVTTRLPPASQAGPAFQPLPDEVELWSESRAEERTLRGAVWLYDDPHLTAYLQEVVDRLTPPGMEANPHLGYTVSVIDAPELNAFAYPHGALYVHTGLLAKLENEDQLATLLGHEMSHVEHRHMLRHRRAMRNREVGFTAASIALSVVLEEGEASAWWDGDYAEAMVIGVLGDMLLGLGLQLAFVASVNGYGRDLEWEADRGGIAKLDAAGYRLAEAPRFYETLRDNATSTEGGAVNFFFGSHPRLTRRAEVARELVAERAGFAAGRAQDLQEGRATESAAATGSATGTSTATGHTSEELSSEDDSPEDISPRDLSPEDRRFRRALAPVVRDQAWWHLAEGRIDAADEHLERALAWAPDDPLVHLLKGQVRLAQSQDAPSPEEESWFRDEAGRAFLEAIRLDPDLPEAHRDLGLMLYEDGEPAGACRELGFYLELAPGAEDADWVRDYVADLEPLGVC